MNPCELVAAQIGSMFQCSRTERGHVRIRTPFYYPDGGIIDLFLVQRAGTPATVTDFGEALGWLRLQSVGGRRSPKQEKLVQDVCTTLGVELFKGQLVARVGQEEKLAETLLRVAQAAVRLGDLWFTMRTRAVESASDEVADFLDEKLIPYERTARLVGRSGRGWQVDFHTRTPARSSLVFVLASGSRAAARRVTEHVYTGWADLSHLQAAGPAPVRFVSLFDDTSDIWADEDFRLLEPVSEIARWSAPDEFERLLSAA
jgi:hypothetical protein